MDNFYLYIFIYLYLIYLIHLCIYRYTTHLYTTNVYIYTCCVYNVLHTQVISVRDETLITWTINQKVWVSPSSSTKCLNIFNVPKQRISDWLFRQLSQDSHPGLYVKPHVFPCFSMVFPTSKIIQLLQPSQHHPTSKSSRHLWHDDLHHEIHPEVLVLQGFQLFPNLREVLVGSTGTFGKSTGHPAR